MTADDGLDIRAGGLIAVDTETLRHVAAVLSQAAADCAELGARLRAAGIASMHAGLWEPSPAGRAEQAQEGAARLARALRDRAEVYELIESEAVRRVSADVGDTLAATLASGRTAPARPDLVAEASRLMERWRADRHREIDRQLVGAAGPVPVAALLTALTGAMRAADRGVIAPHDPPLWGEPAPTTLTELSREQVAAPATLADIAARMPGDGDGRVRVETYESASGRQFVVYIAGTQDFGLPRDEPWDMASNVELYLGRASSSYDAVQRAMAAAGAVAGDRVHIAGHSQGGMVATHLARQGGFDVATLITFASPVQAQLGDDVLSVTVRHTDDPVVALSVGGLPVVAGSRDSFVVERVADPQPRARDFLFGVHQMAAYRETATLIDASDDPRVDALRVQLAGLGTAVAATAVVYGARRDDRTFTESTPARNRRSVQ